MKKRSGTNHHELSKTRWWLAALTGVAALALVPLGFHSERHLETTARLDGSESQYVARQLAERFRSPYADRIVLVARGIPAANTAEGVAALRQISDDYTNPDVAILSYANLPDPIFLGRGGGTFLLIGVTAHGSSVEDIVSRIRGQAGAIQKKLRARYPQATLELTGETPLNFDLRKASADDVNKGESRVLPLTLALLLLAFGSFIAALIPIAVGQLAISTTLAMVVLFTSHWHFSILIQNVAAMLGLGLGIDYALLMVSRFREGLTAGQDRKQAAADAATQAGRTLLVSAATVCIGFGALLAVPVNEIRSVGIAGLLVAAASVLLTNTVVPAVLCLLGARIDFGAIGFLRRLSPNSSEALRDQWRRWGRFVTHHPWKALIVSAAPLLVLAVQGGRLNTDLPRGDWLPPAAESVRALHSLDQMDRAGVVMSLRVILELPSASIWHSQAGWDAAAHLAHRLASDPRTDRIISLSTMAQDDRDLIGSLPSETRRTFLRGDEHATAFEVLPKSSVGAADQIRWVQELRALSAPNLTGMRDAKLSVGGIPALNADYKSAVGDRLGSVIGLVVGSTMLALFVSFRSFFAAAKAVALNLLTVGAAFGTLVLVFQEGHGGRILGLQAATGSVFPIVPILTFAIVFGLSMDYEVFLVARVLELRRSGLSESEAIAEGLARTAGLITSAAAIMIAVFVGFTLGDFLVIKMLGLALMVAVLIDATVVRMVIGPALLTLAGDWNWWPWGLRGAQPAEVHT